MMTVLLMMLAFRLLDGAVLVVVCFYALLAGAGFSDLLIAWLIHPILGVVWDVLRGLPRTAFGRRSGASPDAAASPSPHPARRVRIGLTEWDLHAMPDGSEVFLPRGGGHHAHAGHRGDLGRRRAESAPPARPGRASVRPDGRAPHPAMRRTPS